MLSCGAGLPQYWDIGTLNIDVCQPRYHILLVWYLCVCTLEIHIHSLSAGCDSLVGWVGLIVLLVVCSPVFAWG